MAFKTVKAHPEIIRRQGLGAQQCVDCGAVYRIENMPKECACASCPSNEGQKLEMDDDPELDSDRDDGRRQTKYGPKGSDY